MTIELVDSDTRLLITLNSGWGIKLNPSECQEIADALAEQGVKAMIPEPTEPLTVKITLGANTRRLTHTKAQEVADQLALQGVTAPLTWESVHG